MGMPCTTGLSTALALVRCAADTVVAVCIAAGGSTCVRSKPVTAATALINIG
jgi:hypothetical protein